MTSIVTYNQSSGTCVLDGVQLSIGYSGHGKGLNNTAMESAKGEGPIPRGLWRIGTWVDHPHLGPIVAALSPIKLTSTFGRSAFFIHGDNREMNHTGSDGCIILDRATRLKLKASGATQLEVV